MSVCKRFHLKDIKYLKQDILYIICHLSAISFSISL